MTYLEPETANRPHIADYPRGPRIADHRLHKKIEIPQMNCGTCELAFAFASPEVLFDLIFRENTAPTCRRFRQERVWKAELRSPPPLSPPPTPRNKKDYTRTNITHNSRLPRSKEGRNLVHPPSVTVIRPVQTCRIPTPDNRLMADQVHVTSFLVVT